MPVFGGFSDFWSGAARVFTNQRGGPGLVPWLFNRLPITYAARSIHQRFITNRETNLPEGPAEIDAPDIQYTRDEETGEFIEIPEDPAIPSPVTHDPSTFEFSLYPFKLILRAIRIPLLGLVDLAATAATPVYYTMAYLFHHSVPLSNLTRLSRGTGIVRKPFNYMFCYVSVITQALCFECNKQGRNVTEYGEMYDNRDLEAVPTCRCLPICAPWYNNMGDIVTVEESEILVSTDHPQIGMSPPDGTMVELWRRWFSIRGSFDCPHPQVNNSPTSSYQIPYGTPDTLSYQPVEARWKHEVTAFGARCLKCFPRNMHGWHDILIQILVKKLPPNRIFFTAMEQEELMGLSRISDAIIRWCDKHLVPHAHYYLISISQSRVEQFSPFSTQDWIVFIVPTNAVKNRIIQKFPQYSTPATLWLILPVVRDETSFAGWRLVVMALNEVPAWLHCVNQSQIGYRRSAIDLLAKTRLTWSSLEFGNIWPFFMGNAIAQGGTSRVHPQLLVASFYCFGCCYGWDEIVPALMFKVTVLIAPILGLPPLLAPQVEEVWYNSIRVSYALFSPVGQPIGQYLGFFNRQTIGYMKALAIRNNDDGLLNFWAGFTDPRAFDLTIRLNDFQQYEWTDVSPRDPRFDNLFVAGDNILAEITTSVGGLVFFTFGTRGDRNPVLAHCRYLATLGARVTVIHLCSLNEGVELISKSTSDERRVYLFNRARSVVSTFKSGYLVTPYQLLLVNTITYSLSPPANVVYPFRASDNPIISLLYSLVGMVMSPDFYIGAYAQPLYLPTSTDGTTFLELTPNMDTTNKKVGAWWGSDGAVPDNYGHIPLIPAGDHKLLFPQYSVVYCHGGAGTVALASASGCQVIVVSEGILDRDYIHPHDAGALVMPGAPVDAMFLALSKNNTAFAGVWFRFNWFRPWKYLNFYGVAGVFRMLFHFFMWYLFMTRTQKNVPLTSEPLTSVLMLFSRTGKVKLVYTLIAYFVAVVLERLLLHLGKNYYWVANHFFRLNYNMVTAIVPFYIAQKYGYLWGLIAGVFSSFVATSAQTFVSWVLSVVAPKPDLVGYNALYFEVSLRYHKIPVLHLAVVSPSTNMRYEGGDNQLGLYELTWREGSISSPFLFKTDITVEDISTTPNVAYKYSLFWNCQTALVMHLWPYWHRSGLGGVVGLITLAGISIVNVTCAVGITFLYGTSMVLPRLFGVAATRHGTTVAFGQMVSSMVDEVFSAPGNPFVALNNWMAGIWQTLT